MEGSRHISCVEKIENLRTFIKQDLRDMGIKLPKNKKAKKLNNSRGVSQDGVMVASSIFGNYLAHVPCEFVTDCGYVPKFLVDAGEVIKIHVRTEGVFRKSGSVSRQKELKQHIEDGCGMDISSICDLTTLIKQFFRELPEPLFTSLYHDTFIKCYWLEDSKSVSRAILSLCLLLPGEHLSTLRFIMQLFAFVASYSDDNKMDAANLAVVLAPNIMHVNSKSEKMNSTEERLLQIQTAIVELLIRQAAHVGMVSESLYRRAELMSECFGATDEELDASDDNTLEDSKEMRKKKKKRKRSGSFHGFVSSIAHGLAKLRRSTDGRGNSSQNNLTSDACEKSHCAPSQLEQTHPQYPATTPVVMRKRKASGEVIPFSASKKKAILQHLPQGSVLGHTPFTPASAIKKIDMSDRRHGMVIDTPSITDRLPFSATPSHSIKTPRKKLNLFSPSSTKKKIARSPSFSNVSTGSTKKSTRGRSIFRRLSGSKADKSSASDSSLHVGERLASPPNNGAPCMRRSQSEADSPILALEQKVSYDTEHTEVSPLNEGFINESHLDFDNTDLGGGLQRSHSLYRPVQASVSDSVVCAARQGEDKAHQRSLSAEMMSLRRGQPNTITNGLLKGKPSELRKLRNSFDKSDISGPMPMIHMVPPDVPQDPQLPLPTPNFNASLMNVILPPPTGFNDTIQQTTGYDSDESEAGFSTISGDTVIYMPVLSGSSASLQSRKSHGQGRLSAQSSKGSVRKYLQPSDSSDSLLSSASEISLESDKPKMERTLSADSGKGSLLDETVANAVLDVRESLDVAFVADESVLDSTVLQRSCNLDSTVLQRSCNLDSTVLQRSSDQDSVVERDADVTQPSVVKKSVSAQQLTAAPRPVVVVRSHSMYTNQEARRHNIKPNLLISAETHKILSRAGYIAKDGPHPKGQDFRLPVKSPPRLHSFNLSRRSMSADHSMFNDSRVHKTTVAEIPDVSGSVVCEARDPGNVSNVIKGCEREKTVKFGQNVDNNNYDVYEKDNLHDKVMNLPQIKRAEVRIQKHESVSAIHASNAGKVAENVKHFVKAAEGQFANNSRQAPRQRGMSPVRIPTIFAKSADASSRYREMAQAVLERSRMSSDTTVSDVTGQSYDDSLCTSSSLSSITDSDPDEAVSQLPSALEDHDRDQVFKHPPPIYLGKSMVRSVTSPDDSLEMEVDADGNSKISFEGQHVELSCSLLDTINEICTPNGRRNPCKRSPLKDRGNSMGGSPSRRISDHMVLRTARGMTPRQVLRFSRCGGLGRERSPRKRLSSPGLSSLQKNPPSPSKLSSTSLPESTSTAI